MKLPEWTDERHIYIVAGQEIVAKRIDGIWYKKVERCNFCGKCCMNLSPDWHWGVKENGECSFLENTEPNVFICRAPGMPWDCLKGDGQAGIGCTVRYEEVNVLA